MSDLTERNPAFRAWVETFPDEHWAKKDLSACRLGWDAATQRCIDAGNNLITEYPETDFDKTINQGIRIYQEALEKQE